MQAKTLSTEPVAAAECHGVKVPDSPLLNETRIERINAARYEGQEIAGALAVVRPGDKVLEMGAGLGLVGAIVAKNAKPAKVTSFEANPALIPHIKTLYAMNDLQGTIEVRNEVLISAPDAPQTMPFHVRNSYLGSSLIDTDTRATTRVDVPTARYKVIHAAFAPDVLLMDIEGGELDFLRHASLKGVRAIVIEFHPDAYGRDGMRECKQIIERAGFAKVPEHCTRLVWTCVHAPQEAAPMPDGGWSTEMTRVSKAFIVPGAERQFVQHAGVLEPDGTYVATGALWRNGRALTIQPEMPKGDLPLRRGTWLWGGVLWMHFGHFLTESMARLWALHHVDEDIDGILFIPKRPRNGDQVLAYQRELIALMGTDLPVACAAAPERVERLIVPGQGMGLGNMSAGTAQFQTAVRAHFAKDIAADGPDKLYISRSALPDARGALIGEPELEAALQAEGYTIYHPEQHDIPHQIATYKAARQVIAAEGSALHLLAMVADKDKDIGLIVRRPSGATKNLEVHIASLSGKAPLTFTHLKRVWKPVGAAKPRIWKGELDMARLQSGLQDAGLIRGDAPEWTSLTAEEVQTQLGDGYEQAPVEG